MRNGSGRACALPLWVTRVISRFLPLPWARISICKMWGLYQGLFWLQRLRLLVQKQFKGGGKPSNLWSENRSLTANKLAKTQSERGCLCGFYKGPVLKDVEENNNDNIFHVFSTIPTESSQNTPQTVCGENTTPKNVITQPGVLPGLTAFSFFFSSFSLPSPSQTNDSIFISPQHY